MGITVEQLSGVSGHGKLVTDQGDRVGDVGQIYLDDTTGAPSWVTVRTGLFGTAETFVPVDSARLSGRDLVVAYAKDTIKTAPRVDADGSLSPEEEQTLYRHYGLRSVDFDAADQNPGREGVGDAPSDLDDHSETAGHRRDLSDKSVGQDRSGPTTDTAMTRSEEHLAVGTRTVESGRARLRKYVVTEQVSETVPVRHEEARLVREPITDANRGNALTGPAISEEEHEVVLHAETPVVDKTAVPVERIKLNTATVTSQETVSGDVRKEQIEVEDPSTPGATKPTPGP